MSVHEIVVDVNGDEHRATVESRTLLVHFLREALRLTAVKVGCDTTSCGACTVIVDGRAVKSCTMFAVQADGAVVETVEGLAGADGGLAPIQSGFWEEHGLQCGYCTGGMMMAAVDLLRRDPDPSDQAIRQAISGNLCRCTGYANIVAAIRWAARNPNG